MKLNRFLPHISAFFALVSFSSLVASMGETVGDELVELVKDQNITTEVAGNEQNIPKAKNIDLSDPVVVEDDLLDLPAPAVPVIIEPKKEEYVPKLEELKNHSVEKDIKYRIREELVILNTAVAKGTSTRLSWSPKQTFEGIALPTPVLVVNGLNPGPTLCMTAAVHGDELTGIEVIRRVMYDIDVNKLSGTVIGVPIVNLQGFVRGSRYLIDRRDLNRFFPGNEQGSSAARIAYSFFKDVVAHCDLLVDIHTGSFYRTNLPQLRADLTNPDVVKLTQAFDAIAVLHSEGASGTLRRAAVDAGIPSVTLEAGGPMELEETYVVQGVKAVRTLLDKLKMLDTISFWGTPQPTYYGSQWIRVDKGGILFSEIKLGARVKKGDLLGRVTDPVTNIRANVFSPVDGRIIGMAVNQVVLPGFAAYHIGLKQASTPSLTSDQSISIEGAQDNDEEEESGFDEYD